MELWFFLVLVASYGLTGVGRRYALKKNIIDIPNARSSHLVPTPRGGGVSIVVTFLAVLIGFMWEGLLSFFTGGLLFVAGTLVAIVGWLDDHGHIRAVFRLLVHLISSTLIVYAIGGMPNFIVFGAIVDWGLFADFLAVLALVWILNLFNFMDGIDGIAGVEAISFTLFVGLIFIFVFDLTSVAYLFLFMSASVTGFLIWNFPPAKIFMGDAGSGFLGLMLGALTLYAASIEPQMFWVCLIMLGLFIVDATYTLFRRLLRRDKIYEAHRSHAYQYASRYYLAHLPVTLAVLAINMLWLAPISYFVAIERVDGAVGALIAYLPLIWLAWLFKAGELEKVGAVD